MWLGGEISKCSQPSFDSFISKVKYTTPAPQKKQADDKISIYVD
jgi:hypothetical protein